MTTVANLVVTPSPSAVWVSFTTTTAVRAQLQVGTASGTYGTRFTLESQPATTHLLNGGGLAPGTTYHYILQFYDAFGNVLDATTDATFVTLAAPTGGAAPGAIIGPLLAGSGVPPNSMGSDGNFYFRLDGAAGAAIYQRRAGAWVATTA